MKKSIKPFFLISILFWSINCFAQNHNQEIVIGTYCPVGHSIQCDIKYHEGLLFGLRYITLSVPKIQEFAGYGEFEMSANGGLVRKEFIKIKQLMLEHTAKAKMNPHAYQKPKKIYTSKFGYSMIYNSYRPESKKDGMSGDKLVWKLIFQDGVPYIYFEHALGRYTLSLDNVDSIIQAVDSENIKRCINKPTQSQSTSPNVPIGIIKG